MNKNSSFLRSIISQFLVYTKTMIHLSVGTASGGYLPRRDGE